jgi:hypothetical protein
MGCGFAGSFGDSLLISLKAFDIIPQLGISR